MVLTEEKIKELCKKDMIKELKIEKGTILTPSARQFLSEKGITILKADSLDNKVLLKEDTSEKQEIQKPKYQGMNGEVYFVKPENMTQIKDNILVNKTHSRIKFRGQLDSLYSEWILMMKELDSKKNQKLHTDLKSIEEFIKEIVKAEILEEKLKDIKVLGESLEKIKEISHNPKKYFDLKHLFNIDSDYDLLVLKLNKLRTKSREVEILGVEAFYKVDIEIDRKDLLLALNRLSSAIYILMLKGVKGEYGVRKNS